MKVRVLSKGHFDSVLPRMKIDNSNVESHTDKAFISITAPYKEDDLDYPEEHYFDKNYSNVLNLEFDDTTEEENEHLSKSGKKELILFSKEQAKKIIEFIELNKHVETLYVHCLAGVSRSGAVGMFINDLYGEENYFEFSNRNPYIHPNYYIVGILKQIYNA